MKIYLNLLIGIFLTLKCLDNAGLENELTIGGIYQKSIKIRDTHLFSDK